MSIQKRLEEWVRHGLLTAEQAQAIATFEARNDASPRRSWALYGLGAVGVVAVATGIVSLIAANWEGIPAAAKLAAYFVVQVGLGLAFLKQADKQGLAREVLLALFALLFLGGIGLVGQIYHLHSDGWQGLGFWLLISLPAALLAQSRLLPHVWWLTYYAAFVVWTVAGGDTLAPRRGMASLGAVLAAAAVGAWQRSGFVVPAPMRRAAFFWCSLMILVGGTVLGSLLWSYGTLHEDFKDFRPFLYLPWVGLALALASLTLSRAAYKAKMLYILMALGVAVTAYVTFPLAVALDKHGVAGALLFVLIWALAGAAAVQGRYRRLFDFATVVIALRIIVVYFEVFGSMALTGIGLILSGIFILGVAFGWHRYRHKISAWMATA